jgi:hypothetical protein
MMPPLGRTDLLDDLAKSVVDSADATGTFSLVDMSQWVEIATIRINYQSQKIKQLETLIKDVMEHHGLSAGY